MKHKVWSLPAFVCTAAILIFASTTSLAQTSAFNYQGKLAEGGAATNGTYQMQFSLYDDVTGGSQVGTTLTFDGGVGNDSTIQVVNGLFSALLDFGPTPFASGQNLYLEINVKKVSDTAYTTLTPRQRLVSVPYAQRSAKAAVALLAEDTLSLGGYLPGYFFSSLGGTVAGNITVTGTSTLGSVSVTSLAVGGNTTVTGSITSASLSTGSIAATGNATVGGDLAVAGAISGDGSDLRNLPLPSWIEATATPVTAVRNRSYVATSATQATITLPSYREVGDVIKITGPGAGGWKLQQTANDRVTSRELDDSLNVYATATAQGWSDIAASANGLTVLATSSSSGLYLSKDGGLSWNEVDTVRQWSGAAVSADGSKMLATVSGGKIYVSIDAGTVWTERESDRGWGKPAISADGSVMAAVAGSVYLSTDNGSTWTERVGSPSGFTIEMTSTGGTQFVAGFGGVYKSDNLGVSWTRILNDLYLDVACSGDCSKVIALPFFSGQFVYSIDFGNSWAATNPNTDRRSASISSDGSTIALGTTNGQIYISTDSFQTWTPVGPTRGWTGLALNKDGSRLSASAYGNRLYSNVKATSDGETGYLVGAPLSTIELQYWGDGRWMVLSSSGEIAFQ